MGVNPIFLLKIRTPYFWSVISANFSINLFSSEESFFGTKSFTVTR